MGQESFLSEREECLLMESQKPGGWKQGESYFINSHSLQLAFEDCLLPMQSGLHELFINESKSPKRLCWFLARLGNSSPRQLAILATDVPGRRQIRSDRISLRLRKQSTLVPKVGMGQTMRCIGVSSAPQPGSCWSPAFQCYPWGNWR